MDFIDVKYINTLSSQLLKFKKVKNNLYNFRCPFCGDSQKNKNKARGYFYDIKNNTNYKCHNCGLTISLSSFIKTIDINLYKQYTLDKFKDNHTGKNFSVKEPKFNFHKPKFRASINLPKANENLEAKKYLENRKLNSYKFFYAEKFKSWVNSIKHTFDDLKYDEPRIVIPLFYKKELIGFQGRALGPSKVKYITIMLDENAPKIYGLDEIQKNKTVYITEGPFDSNFISNSVALCGADGNINEWIDGDLVWVYDNEPRNAEIVSRISSTIERGDKVVIWPSSILAKDINDLILQGFTENDIMKVVEDNTYSGIEAKLKFTIWKRV